MKLTDTIQIRVSRSERKRGKQVTVVTTEDASAKIYGPLALHHDILYGKRQTWRITHIATGLRVLGELTLKDAVAIIKEIRDLPDWANSTLGDGRTEHNAEAFDRLYHAVRKARDFHLKGVAQVAA